MSAIDALAPADARTLLAAFATESILFVGTAGHHHLEFRDDHVHVTVNLRHVNRHSTAIGIHIHGRGTVYTGGIGGVPSTSSRANVRAFVDDRALPYLRQLAAAVLDTKETQ